MKKFSKIALSVAAVSAVTAAMAVSASAAMTATYDADAGTVKLDGVTSTGQSQTLLVLDGEKLQTIADTNIKQIDQKDDSTSFDTVKVGQLKDGTYEVRIGGDGNIQTATFTVGGGQVDPPGPTHSVLIGDVDLNGKVTSGDASVVVTAVSERTTDSLEPDAKIAAQKCDGFDDTRITSGDASEILIYTSERDHEYVNQQFSAEE